MPLRSAQARSVQAGRSCRRSARAYLRKYISNADVLSFSSAFNRPNRRRRVPKEPAAALTTPPQ